MRQDALDAYAVHERIIAKMRKQLSNMDYKEIDKRATEKKLVETELKRVQKATQQAAKAVLGSDPRQAYKGVRVVKYKRIMGGNINILSPRKGGAYVINTADIIYRKRYRYRSSRTKALQEYAGPSRSFVLRFIEGGTIKRTAGTKYSSKGGSGNRGIIKAKHFMSTAQSQMSSAPERLWKQLEIVFDDQFKA